MNKYTFFCLLPLLLILSSSLMVSESSMEVENTTIPTLASSLEGEWLVEEYVEDNKYNQVGTLTIYGDSYKFQLIPDVEVPLWMKERFCFFVQPEDQISYEYESGIFPDDDVRIFEDHAILLKCYGIGYDEYFLIRVDQENQELYLHSWFSELQLYRIHKKYEY